MPENINPSQTQGDCALPNGFEGLARFSNWILATDAERIERRLTTPFAETQLFYEAMMAELDKIMPYLLGRPVADASPEDRALLHLTLSFVEISDAVDIYGQGAVTDGADLRRFISVLTGKPRGSSSVAR
jgi:hypothetical protein